MPRGGHNAKPVALHQLHGTYRKGRHGAAWELEQRLRRVPDYFCGFCGTREFPLAKGDTERAAICPACAVGAVLAFRDSEDADYVADLFKSVGLSVVVFSDGSEMPENGPETSQKQAKSGTKSSGK